MQNRRQPAYLSEKERASLPRYKRLQLARKIYAFRYYNPNNPHPREWDAKAAEQNILPLLSDCRYSAELYEDMIMSMTVMSLDDGDVYRITESALRDMAHSSGENILCLRTCWMKFCMKNGRRNRRKKRQRQEKLVIS